MKCILAYLMFSLLMSAPSQANDAPNASVNENVLAQFSVHPLTSPSPPHHPFPPKLSTCTCFARNPELRGDIGGVGSSSSLARQNALANCFGKAQNNHVNAKACQIVSCTMCR